MSVERCNLYRKIQGTCRENDGCYHKNANVKETNFEFKMNEDLNFPLSVLRNANEKLMKNSMKNNVLIDR